MSEKAPAVYVANNVNTINETITTAGSRVYKGIDTDGNPTIIAADKILEDSGYNPARDKSDFNAIKWQAPTGRSETGSGIADSESSEYQQAYSDALSQHADRTKAKAIEDRINSPEGQKINDAAELSIFGSRGRTYIKPGAVPTGRDDKTGQPIFAPADVIADAKNPYKGKIQEIRENRRFGLTEAERDASADKYEAEVTSLANDGFEIAQIEMIMDMRMDDKIEDRVEHHATNLWNVDKKLSSPKFASRDEAFAAAQKVYELKDKKRLETIKSEGYMTMDEYRAKRTGIDTTAPDPTTPRTPADLTDDQITALENSAAAEIAVEEARNRYIELAAERRKLGFGLRRSKRNSAVEEALNEYNVALERVGTLAKESLDLEGLSDDDILTRAKITWAQESELLNVEGLQTRQEELANNSRFTRGFNNWWTRQTAVQEDGSKARFGRLKKVAVMAAIGTGTTLATGAIIGATGVGFGAILPAALAWRFAKGQAVGRISRNADASAQAEVHNSAVHAETLDRIDNATSLLYVNALTGLSHEKTTEYVKQNRWRTAGSAVIGATGGIVAESLITDRFDDIKGSIGDAKDWLSDKLGNLKNPLDSSSGSGNGGASSPDGAPGAAETPTDGRVLPGGVTTGVNPEDLVPTSEGVEAVAQALDDRTAELMTAEGNFPWGRAADIYGGNDATPRLIEAVETLKAQGIDAGWNGDIIVVNGNMDVNYVWNALAPVLAEQDLENFFANAG